MHEGVECDCACAVSICIPAYCDPGGVRRCLDSILAQTFLDYEVIISDDSPDSSVADVLLAFRSLNIKYVRNVPALGTPKNWNHAIQLASGRLVKVMHHDDWFRHNESLGFFVKMMELNPEALLGFGASFDTRENECVIRVNSPTKSLRKKIERDPHALLCGNYIGSPSAVIYRNSESVFFDENYKWLVDIEFYIRKIGTRRILAYDERASVNIGISEHQVTQSCIGNPNVVVREFLLLYDVLGFSVTRYVADCLVLSRIFWDCRIASFRKINEYGKMPNEFVLLVCLLILLNLGRKTMRMKNW